MPRRELWLAILAGLVWTLYNMALIIVLAFAPDYLVSQGASVGAASAMVSLVGWLIMPGLVAGGWIAARTGRPDLTMAAFLASAALAVWLVPATGGSVALFALIGLLFGPPGPLIMTLPVQAVGAANRAVGMGVYFTCYYVGMGVAPALAGLARDATGASAAPLILAGAILAGAVVALAGFRAAARSGSATG